MKIASVYKIAAIATTVLLGLMAPMAASKAVGTPGFRPFGQTVYGPKLSSNHVSYNNSSVDLKNFGSVVQLSSDGSRMAVGANNNENGGQGAIFVYERDFSAYEEDVAADSTWKLIFERQGTPEEDQFGNHLSLSGDGDMLAVRRDGNTVDIYQYDDDEETFVEFGNPILCCEGSNGKAVKLDKLRSTSAFGESTWILVSCESFDEDRGKVEILRYSESFYSWLPFTTIEGEEQGQLFGWDLGLFTDGVYYLTIAVASPNYDQERGLVQVFITDRFASNTTQLGGALLGEEPGDRFGFSMDMSAYNLPMLVVGAPQYNQSGIERGYVSVYSWAFFDGKSVWDWRMMGDTLKGTNDNDNFGHAVAFSKNGEKVAASSVHFGPKSGYVRLYEKSSSEKLLHVGDFFGLDSSAQWGYSVAINEAGAVLASTSVNDENPSGQSVGSVQVFMDDRGFCSEPFTYQTNEAFFLTRFLCRDRDRLITSAQECASQYSIKHQSACFWVEDLATGSPSASPSSPPSVSAAPSDTPSDFPSLAPTTVLSLVPTKVPSPSPSIGAAATQFQGDSPSDEPSSGPSDVLSLLAGMSLFLPVVIMFIFCAYNCYKAKDNTGKALPK